MPETGQVIAFDRTARPLGFADISPIAIIIEMSRLISAPALVAIPLFTFAGYLMAESKTPERMVNVNAALFYSHVHSLWNSHHSSRRGHLSSY